MSTSFFFFPLSFPQSCFHSLPSIHSSAVMFFFSLFLYSCNFFLLSPVFISHPIMLPSSSSLVPLLSALLAIYRLFLSCVHFCQINLFFSPFLPHVLFFLSSLHSRFLSSLSIFSSFPFFPLSSLQTFLLGLMSSFFLSSILVFFPPTTLRRSQSVTSSLVLSLIYLHFPPLFLSLLSS